MYHCHIHFYLIGQVQDLLDQLRAVPAPEHFTYSFTDGSALQAQALSQADVIFASLQNTDPAALLRGKRENAALIVLAGREQTAGLSPYWEHIDDLWPAPLSDEEALFRFRRWQRTYQSQLDLWQTSQYLDATINSVPNLIWYKDKNGIHEKVNDSFCRTVNKTKQQVQGRGHAYIWDVEQDDPACIESEQEVMRTRTTRVSEETVQTGGGVRQLTTYKSPLYDLDGSVMGTVGVGIDVTKERAYAQELARKNQTLEALFTTMDCGVMCHSLDGSQILSINRAALEILGYASEAELAADGFDMIAATVHKDDRQSLREKILSLKQVGDTINVEYRVQHKDGKLLHIMGNIKLMEEDGTLFYQRFLLDCTDQKLQEKTQQMARERRQRGLVQALTSDYNLVCSFDLDTGSGEPLRVHDCEYNVLDAIFTGEAPIQDRLARYIDRCVYPDDQDMLRNVLSLENLRSELSEKDACYVNYRTICGEELRYFQLKAVRVGDWTEHHETVLGFRSVDEETRREMEKKSLLEDALAQANRASKAKSVFLSNMSHDIRTPTNAIIGFTNLAATHIDQRDQVESYLKKIMTSGNHLLSLINDILDMSRIESGKLYLEEKPCSLPDILHGLRNIVQADIHSKQLELYMDAVDIVNEDIYCDRLRLNQILLNLLGNAIKYTGAGGTVSVKVSERPGAPAGCGSYEFCVSDTGIGMSEEFVSHIFEPFERERNSTTSGIQGTGLGMAITKNIVDMMNGTIHVKSKQGVGSEFTVAITFRLCSGRKEPQFIPQLKDCRALVVDDDFNTCDSVSCMLQQIGMRAEWTLSGKEAVLRTRQSVMRNDIYSVYIIDWLLPDMNGIEVARRIRKETGGHAPIIVLTAYDWSDIEEEAKEAGVSAFCSKPLFLSELRGCLCSVVGLESAEDPADETLPSLSGGRILLAEDNELNQEIAMAILEEEGFSIDVADNGQIALEMLKNSQPGHYQLILMDVQMPVMDGYQATQAIRRLADPGLASIPILAMTANAFEEDKQNALRSGMNGHIAKPIDIAVLLKTLSDVLKPTAGKA